MGKLPWFPMYVADFMADPKVQAMSLAAKGAYFWLLCCAWQSEDCSVPADDEELAAILGDEWQGVVSKRVRAMFTEQDGRLYNKRLAEEKQKQTDKHEKRVQRAKAAADKRWSNAGGNATGIPQECQSESESESESEPDKELAKSTCPSDDGRAGDSSSRSQRKPSWKDEAFKRFWDVVWYKTAKKAAYAVFKKEATDKETAERIIQAAEAQGPRILAGAKKRDGVPVNPARWLKEGRYDDEAEPGAAQADLTDEFGRPING